MDNLVIYGGNRLLGDVYISGSKNSSLPIMVASLLTDQPLIILNIPKLSDINTMKHLLLNHGVKIIDNISDNNTITLISSEINNFVAPYDIVRKMRASIWVLAPLLARLGEAKVSFPGGCAIGVRKIDLHIMALKVLGASINIVEGYIHAKIKEKYLIGNKIVFNKYSVGATITAILAAVLAKGESSIINCAKEPEVIDLCRCLINMGAEIYGIGTNNLVIIGKKKLGGTRHKVIADRIEAGTYMIAAAITKGQLRMHNIVNYSMLTNLITPLQKAGVKINLYKDYIDVNSSSIIAPININTSPYPGFSTDLQAQFMSLMTIASGTSIITENIFENRFMHVAELCRMGAQISVNGNEATIIGVTSLSGSELMASDLRASASLVLAALAAHGKTVIHRIYHLDRGYEAMESKLFKCGADIIRQKDK